jgi:hypothetical protein
VAASDTDLCVGLQRSQTSVTRGQAAQWTVSAWTKDGNVPSATLRLTASPTSQVPEFSFGCGSYDGTASCSLGSVYSDSGPRQVIASVAIPASTTLTAVQLTATGSASGLSTDPSASVTVPVDSSTSTTNSSTPATSTSSGSDGSTVSQLPVGSLPAISGNGATSSISPGGNAAGLFPTINPSQDSGPGSGQAESARQVADSEALPIGTPVVDAQVLGLGALAVAFLLAVTRLSVRRRPATAMASGRGAASAASIAPARVEAVAPAPARTDDATREDLVPGDAASVDPASGDDEAAGGEAETRDDIKPIGAPPWELGDEK